MLGALRGRPRWLRLGLAALFAAALVAGLTWVYARSTPDGTDRCHVLADRYGLTPCPPDPVPLEPAEIRNLDPGLSDRRAHEIGTAYLRSRALYYLAIVDNSEKFFRSAVIHRPDETPAMFDAEIGHIRDAKAARGPESQVIRVPGKPDQPVSTLGAGDSYRLLVGGVLLEPAGLGETFAELGQWECLDPDMKGACLS